MKAEISFGIGFDQSGDAIPFPVAQGYLADVLRESARRFGGGFITGGVGSWLPPDYRHLSSPGALAVPLVEQGGVLSILGVGKTDDDRRKVAEFAEWIRDLFDQEEVLVTYTEVETASVRAT